MRRLAERPPAPVDERGAHAEALGPDAVEGMVGDEQQRRPVQPDQFLGLGVSLPGAAGRLLVDGSASPGELRAGDRGNLSG